MSVRRSLRAVSSGAGGDDNGTGEHREPVSRGCDGDQHADVGHRLGGMLW